MRGACGFGSLCFALRAQDASASARASSSGVVAGPLSRLGKKGALLQSEGKCIASAKRAMKEGPMGRHEKKEAAMRETAAERTR